jgi:hypothetical protein
MRRQHANSTAGASNGKSGLALHFTRALYCFIRQIRIFSLGIVNDTLIYAIRVIFTKNQIDRSNLLRRRLYEHYYSNKKQT